jgi:hypothetical protein
MRKETNSIDYGIYIDGEKAFVIALDHLVHEALISNIIFENHEPNPHSGHVSSQEHVQNRKNGQLKKFCKSIIENVANANCIVVFGPSTSKFELQKEIQNTKRLNNVKEELVVADVMDKTTALQFVKNFYTPVLSGQQIFTGRKRK